MSTFDWGAGRYEDTAAQLEPAARAVVQYGAPAAGEHVIDIGCGTGNAALLAAERGAKVTGIDPAPRLLEVAARRAAALGLEAQFVRAEAAALPIEDGAADLVVSVFGVIFAPEPRAAAAEMVRVTAPDGRIVLTAWNPSGAVHRFSSIEDRLELGEGSPRQSWRGDSAFVNQWMVNGADAATLYGVVTLLFNWTM